MPQMSQVLRERATEIPTWRRVHTQRLLSLPTEWCFCVFLSCKSQWFCTSSSRLPVFKRAYSREFLLDVGRITFLEINSVHAEELWDLGLLRRPTPSPTPTTVSRPTSGVRGSRRGVSAEVSELG